MTRKKENQTVESQKLLELKKHVATIHSGNKYSLLQRKIANALLFNAYDELLIKDEHEIHISTLCKLIGYDSNDHKTIKRALVNLLSTVLEWNLVDGERLDGAAVWNASSIIADASIDGAICNYSYSNKMKKLLYRPNMYGRLDMLVQAKFQSSYGLALYENCNRFQDIGQTPWFDILKFRKLMGVDEGKYKIFRDFKTRVLDKAVDEVNKYSPIFISAQLRRQKRQVVAIQFIIKKSKIIQTTSNTELCEMGLKDILKLRFGLSKKQLEQTIAMYEERYIREKIALIEASPSYQNGQIKVLAKYLLSALKDDYQAPKSVSRKPAKEERAKMTERFRVPADASDNLKKIAYRSYQIKELMVLFETMDLEQQGILIRDFEKFMNFSMRGVFHDIYLRDGMKSPLIQDHLYIYIRQNRQEILDGVLPYEDWLEGED